MLAGKALRRFFAMMNQRGSIAMKPQRSLRAIKYKERQLLRKGVKGALTKTQMDDQRLIHMMGEMSGRKSLSDKSVAHLMYESNPNFSLAGQRKRVAQNIRLIRKNKGSIMARRLVKAAGRLQK